MVSEVNTWLVVCIVTLKIGHADVSRGRGEKEGRGDIVATDKVGVSGTQTEVGDKGIGKGVKRVVGGAGVKAEEELVHLLGSCPVEKNTHIDATRSNEIGCQSVGMIRGHDKNATLCAT